MQNKKQRNIITALLIAVAVALVLSATLDNITYGIAAAAAISGGIFAVMQNSSGNKE